jgi:hypothetical protein
MMGGPATGAARLTSTNLSTFLKIAEIGATAGLLTTPKDLYPEWT